MTEYLYLPFMPYGKERRRLIKQWFNDRPYGLYAINCKHKPQLKHDKDLQKLVKTGFLKVVKMHIHPSHKSTFLAKA